MRVPRTLPQRGDPHFTVSCGGAAPAPPQPRSARLSSNAGRADQSARPAFEDKGVWGVSPRKRRSGGPPSGGGTGANPYPYIRRIAKSTICSTAFASNTIRWSPSMSSTNPYPVGSRSITSAPVMTKYFDSLPA